MRLARRISSTAALGAIAIAAGVMTAAPAAAVTPGAPTALATYPVLHGIGLSWKGDYSGATPTSYTVYSRPDAGSSYTQIGTVNASATNHTGTYIDGTIAGGDTEQYAVTETTAGGESAKTSALSATRPATDPIAGSDNAITVDAGSDPTLANEHFDSTQSDTVSLINDILTGTRTGAAASATIPMVAGPGSYSVAGLSTPLGITTNGASCGTETGTLNVIDVAYDLNKDPVLFSASYAISCDGGAPVYGDLRWHSTQPYRNIAISPELVTGVGSPVGHPVYINMTIANTGTETAHVGNLAITGPAASDWSEAGSACTNLTYNATTSCNLQLIFNPSDSGHRTATMTISDNSARGSHSVPLDGVGELAPTAPPTTARVGVHQVQITWTAPNNGGAPITSYLVYKTAPGQSQQQVANISPSNPDNGGSYAETDVPTGVTYEYSVVAKNAAGDSPDAVVDATAPSDEILIDATTAITTAGDEPIAVGSPDIRGRVAVVPGSNRIVYPAKYTGGAIDLATASPYGIVNQMRLTTMGATDPAVSMDGTTVAFVHVSATGEPSIWTVPLSGGSPTKVASDVTNPSWLPSGRALVAEASTDVATPASGKALVTLSLNGTMSDIPGTTDGHEPAVSPDGTAIAYQLFNQGTSSYSLAVVAVAGGAAATSSSGSTAIEDVNWRSDSARLFAAVGGKVKQATVSGTTPGPLTTLSPPDVTGARWPAYINSKAVSLLDPAPVTGKRATVQIGTAAGATSTCRLDGGASSPCNKSWNSVIDLTAGHHTLVVTSTPDTGVGSTAIWSFLVDVAKPTISLHKLPKHTHGKTVKIRYSGHDNDGVASYDVRYAKGSSKHSVGNYHYPASWQATKVTSQTLRVHKGVTYCVSARSRDAANNVSKWSKERCTTGS